MSVALLNKHQQKTAAMKKRLLRAARRVFTRDGFEAARIDDIAAAAGHTRGAFYAHFKTKEDLFLALIEEQSAAHVRLIRARLLGCKTEEERWEALREYYASSLADRQWSILLIEFKLYALRHAKLRPRLAEAHRRVRMILKPEIKGLLPARLHSPAESQEMKRVALEAILTGLTLENAFDPQRISAKDVKVLLRQAFDLMQQLRKRP